jgi:myo-inositol 2-dehydrogenase/D-chiro-inositol 1-dehydrogenase
MGLRDLTNVGFIGLGQMGVMHLVNCQHVEGVRIVGAADPAKKAHLKARAYGVTNIYENYERFLKAESKNLDAVVISVPNFLHFDAIQLSLEAGLNVFAEKPLALNVAQCESIVKLVRDSGRKLMIGHNLRWVPAVEKIKKEYASGKIGDIEIITLEEMVNGPFSHPFVPAPVSDWWFDPQKSGGGALIDIGYHMLDLFRFFTEEEAKVIFTDLSYKYHFPIEEGATVILQSDKTSIRGVVNVGWFQKSVFPKYNFRAILHGASGFLTTDDYSPKNMYIHAGKEVAKNILRRIALKKPRLLSYTYFWESYYKEMSAFLESVAKDLPPPITAIDGLKTIQLIQDSYEFFNTLKEMKTR